MEAKSWIRKRLNWHTNVVVMRATKYLQSEDIGKDSVEKVAEKNGMRHCALTSLIELD